MLLVLWFLIFLFGSLKCPFAAGALVWAKLEGHPWWPCMVVPQPLTGQQMRGRGRAQRIHVHFFDEPPTRGWVSTKYIREYQGRLLLTAIIFFQWRNSFLWVILWVTPVVTVWSKGSDSSDVKPGGVFFSSKPVIRRAMELADQFMFDSPEKRLKMPLCTDPSDEEEDEEEMEVNIYSCSQTLCRALWLWAFKYVL